MTAPAPRDGLARDERGAIMVMGIFMCAILTGALWYVAGIGDAIVFRERMQEAADSVAFSAAIIQARGMNIIVMINLIMACILAIRVAINMIKLVLTVLAAVFWAIAAIPFCEWAAAPAAALTEGAEDMQTLDNEVSPYINDALEALNDAWKGISYATPAAAVAGAVEMETKYSPAREPPRLRSLRRVAPHRRELSAARHERVARQAVRQGGRGRGGGHRLDWDPGGRGRAHLRPHLRDRERGPRLLLRAPREQRRRSTRPLERRVQVGGPATSSICDQADAATQQYNALVAEDASTLAISSAAAQMNSLDNSCTNGSSKAQKGCSNSGSSTSGSSTFTQPDGGVVNTSNSSGSSSSGGDMNPAGLVDGWHNGVSSGSLSAQIIAVITTDGTGMAPTNVSPKFVSIAGQNKVTMSGPSLLKGQQNSWAQAEFFYDDVQPDWGTSQPDAMWNFYWRARFRLSNPGSLPDGEGTVLTLASTSYLLSTTQSGVCRGSSGSNVYTGRRQGGARAGARHQQQRPGLPLRGHDDA